MPKGRAGFFERYEAEDAVPCGPTCAQGAHQAWGVLRDLQVGGSENDRAALVALCKSDNLDSAFALGETEWQMLKAIHDSLEVLQPPLGQTQWDMVRKLAMDQCAQRWAEDDICSIYIFESGWGDPPRVFSPTWWQLT